MRLLIQDIFIVVGREELAFEQALHQRYVQPDTKGPGDLVVAGWLPHGGGEGYEAMTLTAFESAAGVDELIAWGSTDGGKSWNTRIQAMCYSQQSSLHELLGGELSAIAGHTGHDGADGAAVPPALYRFDDLTFDPDLPEITGATGSGDAGEQSVIQRLAWWRPVLDLGESKMTVVYGFAPAGFARAIEWTAVDEPWPGEWALPAKSRRTRLLRASRALSDGPVNA